MPLQLINRFAVALVALMLCGQALADERPNIVFILADDLGYTDLTCTGSDYYQTPNLDRFASQSMIFNAGYANCANCAPTRAALMSGMYAPRTGIYTVGNSDRGNARGRMLIPTQNTTTLAPEVVTIAEVLHDAGYTTAHMGKWHLGDGVHGPENQGFDVRVAGNAGTRSFFSPYNDAHLSDGPEGEYLTERLSREAASFITAHADDDAPFYLSLAYYSVHTPIQPMPSFADRAGLREPGQYHYNAQYAGFVEGLDAFVQIVLDAIDEQGLADNTIVVFASDNGGHGAYTDVYPLRGGKGMFYEGGIRVPLFVRYPGVTQAGATCDEPVVLLDFYPTFTEVAGGQLPTTQPVDGLSLLPLLRDPSASLDREAIFFHFPAYLEAYAGGMDEAHRQPWRATPCSVIRAGDWKLIEYFEDGEVELFNLANDRGEQHNLTADQPERAAQLLQQLHAWQQATDAPIPTERNPAYRAE